MFGMTCCLPVLHQQTYFQQSSTAFECTYRTCFSADCACCHLSCQDRLALAEATVRASLSAAVQAPAG